MRSGPAACLALLFLLPLAAPGVAAQTTGAPGSVVDISAVAVPDRTVADHAFPVQVTLENLGSSSITVELMGALYRSGSSTPCGSAQSERFVSFTQMFQGRLTLAPHERAVYPAQGATPWSHRYPAQEAPPTPATWEFCIFALRPENTQQVQYLDYHAVPLAVRATNTPPHASFSWSPVAPGATEPVRFEAKVEDADGDPVTARWDFGHVNATGRATATGATATHRFYPEGSYTVTLTVSDGFSEASFTRTVDVGPEPPTPTTLVDTPAGGDRDAGTPGFGVPLAVLAALAALSLVRRRA